MISNNNLEPLKVLQAIQVPKEPSSRIYKVNDTNISPQLSNPPDTPTPPPVAIANGDTHALVPPSLPGTYQNALRHIRTVESHNAKLYDDNCKLINAVSMLNERLTFLGAPQNIQVVRLADVQEKLSISEANCTSINQKYQELLQSVSGGSAQHHIGLELQDTREAFASLDREYRLLRDKYIRLKAVTVPDTGRVVQQQSQGITHGHTPVRRLELPNAMPFRGYTHDQSQGNVSFQSFPDQRRDNRRRSSDGVAAQTSLRTGSAPGPIATTWLAPLPTPPPTASTHGSQTSPLGFAVHALIPTGPLPPPHHMQATYHRPRNISEISVVTQIRNLGEKVAAEKNQSTNHYQRSAEDMNDELVTRGYSVTMSSESNTRPQKRPSSDFQAPTSPEGESKKPRIKGEPDCSTTMISDAYPPVTEPASIVSASLHDDCKSSAPRSDVRSYQDCVDLIFEKDADVKDGVFCGLCLDRYEAKMIQEPPDVLTRPDFDSLVMHCMTMHPTAWDDLRHGV